MSPPRLVQNFSGSRAIICAEGCSSVQALARTLANLGLTVEHRDLTERPIGSASTALHPDRDILFLDGDTDVGATWSVPLPGLLPPVPVIALVGHEAPSRLKALMQCGATGFLRKPVHGAGIYSALFVGVNEHRTAPSRSAAQEHEAAAAAAGADQAMSISCARMGWTTRPHTNFFARKA